MFDNIKHSAAMAARKTVLGMMAALLFITGTAFLTVAAWLAISAVKGAVFAACVLGLGYVGAALIVIAVQARRSNPLPHRNAASPPPPTSPMGGVATAFLQGVAAGATARRD